MLFSVPGSIVIQTSLVKSLANACSSAPRLSNRVHTIVGEGGGGRGGRLIDDQMVEIPYIWHFQKSLSTANSSSNTEVRRSPALASAENVLPLQQWLVEEI